MSDLADGRRFFADYASGAISAEQLQSLEAALREDADLRREFIEYMNVDSALGDLAALSKAEVAEIEAAKQEHDLGTPIAGDSVSPAPAGVGDVRNLSHCCRFWGGRGNAVVGDNSVGCQPRCEHRRACGDACVKASMLLLCMRASRTATLI
jgi:hypothetical protein